MEGSGLFRVDYVAFVEEVVVPQLVTGKTVQKNVRLLNIQTKSTPNKLSTLLRKKLPEMLISSQRTTTIFCPFKACLEMIEAKRPRRWPLPSITMGVEEKVAMEDLNKRNITSSRRKSRFWRNRRT